MPDPTQTEQLEIIVRAAMKRTYDKGDHVTNARAFADGVTRQALENEAAIAGSLRLNYISALKQLASDDTIRANPQAYTPWQPDEDPHPVATPSEADRWQRIISLAQHVPRDHELRVAIRERCNWTRPWDSENRRPTPDEQTAAETRALHDLAALEAITDGLTVPLEPVGAGLFAMPSLDDDDIPGYGDDT